MGICMEKIRKELIGYTVNFVNGEDCHPIILSDVTEVIGLESLRKEGSKHKELAEAEADRNLIYAVVGKLKQPYKEVDSNEDKNTKTVYVYSDTEIILISNEENIQI